MPFADSHTHIDLAEFDSDRPALLKRAAEAGVVRMLLVAQADDSAGLDRGLTVARDHGLKASGGLHPHEAVHWSESLGERLLAPGLKRDICAIGEIGLDFHYSSYGGRDEDKAFIPESSYRGLFSQRYYENFFQAKNAAATPVVTKEVYETLA